MKSLMGGALAAAIAMTTASAQTQLVSEDIMVKSPDAGIEIFVRNKRPANMTSFRPERTVVYVQAPPARPGRGNPTALEARPGDEVITFTYEGGERKVKSREKVGESG